MTSGLHIIRISPDGTLEGGADPRREGVPSVAEIAAGLGSPRLMAI